MSLFNEILHCKVRIHRAENKVKKLKDTLEGLIAQRSQCVHEFSSPFDGYEHEGGTCMKCGMSQVFHYSKHY